MKLVQWLLLFTLMCRIIFTRLRMPGRSGIEPKAEHSGFETDFDDGDGDGDGDLVKDRALSFAYMARLD